MKCKVCRTESMLFLHTDRRFFRCPSCWFIFTHDSVSREDEEQHYKGQWEDDRAGALDEFCRFSLKVIRKYREPNRILDFGSGSGGLTEAFRKRGMTVTPLEPMIHGYLKDQEYEEKFDVVVGVEVIEHLPDFWDELHCLEKNLASDGIMVFSTLLTSPFIESPESVAEFQLLVVQG